MTPLPKDCLALKRKEFYEHVRMELESKFLVNKTRKEVETQLKILKPRMEFLRGVVAEAPPGFAVDDIIKGDEALLFKRWIYAEDRARRRRF